MNSTYTYILKRALSHVNERTNRVPVRQNVEKILIIINTKLNSDKGFLELAVRKLLNPDNYTIYYMSSHEKLLDIIIEQNLHYFYHCVITNYDSESLVPIFDYCNQHMDSLLIFSTSTPHPLLVPYPRNIIHIKNYKFITIETIMNRIIHLKDYFPTTHFEITNVTIIYSMDEFNQVEQREMNLLIDKFFSGEENDSNVVFTLVNVDTIDSATFNDAVGNPNINSNTVVILTKSVLAATFINNMPLQNRLNLSEKLTYIWRHVDHITFDIYFKYGLYIGELGTDVGDKLIERYSLSPDVSDEVKIIPDILTRIGGLYIGNKDKVDALNNIIFTYCITLDRNIFWEPSIIHYEYVHPEEKNTDIRLDMQFVIDLDDMLDYDLKYHDGTSVPVGYF